MRVSVQENCRRPRLCQSTVRHSTWSCPLSVPIWPALGSRVVHHWRTAGVQLVRHAGMGVPCIEWAQRQQGQQLSNRQTEQGAHARSSSMLTQRCQALQAADGRDRAPPE